MTTTFALALPHCPWDPHRVRSFARVRAALGIRNDRDDLDDSDVVSARTFKGQGPEPTFVWSERMFAWAAEQSAEWVVQIQDDVLLVPDFWAVAKAALSALPSSADVVSLYTLNPHAAELSGQGCNWSTTTDWMTGPGWAVRSSFAREFWHFRQTRLRAGWQDRIRENSLNEDTLLGLGAAALGRRIWSPIPALVDHDPAAPSAQNPGRAAHRYDRASFAWKDWASRTRNPLAALKDPEYWRPRNTASNEVAVHFGLAYSFTPANFMRWVLDDGGSYGGMTWADRADAIRSDLVQVGQR